MSDISGVSGPQRFTSQLKVSMESVQKQPQIEAGLEMKEIQQFEIEMAKINEAFTLAREIRSALESALRDLS